MQKAWTWHEQANEWCQCHRHQHVPKLYCKESSKVRVANYDNKLHSLPITHYNVIQLRYAAKRSLRFDFVGAIGQAWQNQVTDSFEIAQRLVSHFPAMARVKFLLLLCFPGMVITASKHFPIHLKLTKSDTNLTNPHLYWFTLNHRFSRCFESWFFASSLSGFEAQSQGGLDLGALLGGTYGHIWSY